MTLDRTAIVTALDKWGVTYRQTPEAFELDDGWSLRAGSGIAGRNREWFLWLTRGGRSGGGVSKSAAATLAALRVLLADARLIVDRDTQHNIYGHRNCSRCRCSIYAPDSRISHVFWMHEERCKRATDEERRAFLKTRRWPKNGGAT